MKQLLVALAVALSTLFSTTASAENTALAKEAKQLLVSAENIALSIDENPNAIDDALRVALKAEDAWTKSGARDAEFEEILGHVTNALWASFYLRLAVHMNNTKQFGNVGTVIDVMCEHAILSPKTVDTILEMCVIPEQEG